mgnify:CR=1 FL=1
MGIFRELASVGHDLGAVFLLIGLATLLPLGVGAYGAYYQRSRTHSSSWEKQRSVPSALCLSSSSSQREESRTEQFVHCSNCPYMDFCQFSRMSAIPLYWHVRP